MACTMSGVTTSNRVWLQTEHFTGSGSVAARPHFLQMLTLRSAAACSTSDSASFSVAAADDLGMKRSMASSSRSLVITLWPFSTARR